MSIVGITWAGTATALAIGSAAVSIWGKFSGGNEAEANAAKIAEAKTAAGDYRDAQVGSAQTTHGITTDTLNVAADTSIDRGNQTASSNLTDLVSSVNKVTGKSNMATNKTIDRVKGDAAGSIYSAYNTTTDTAVSSRDLGFRTADVTRETSIASAELDYADRMAALEEEPDEFWEGFWS